MHFYCALEWHGQLIQTLQIDQQYQQDWKRIKWLAPGSQNKREVDLFPCQYDFFFLVRTVTIKLWCFSVSCKKKKSPFTTWNMQRWKPACKAANSPVIICLWREGSDCPLQKDWTKLDHNSLWFLIVVS